MCTFCTYLLHSMSSGQVTPNISMSLWHSSLARWQMDRHGMDTWPYTVHTGAYRAHRNILRSALHTRFTMGWKGCRAERRGEKQSFLFIFKTCDKLLWHEVKALAAALQCITQLCHYFLANTCTFHLSNIMPQYQWKLAWQLFIKSVMHVTKSVQDVNTHAHSQIYIYTHHQLRKVLTAIRGTCMRRLIFNLK